MSATKPDPLSIAKDLIRCPSVTPAEGGALDLLQAILEASGFSCHRLPFAEAGTPDVDNLFARIGDRGPHLCFAGHTDVVPAGDPDRWANPPFEPHVANGALYGRGAADMKGAVACFVAAAQRYLGRQGGTPPGSISLLITGDEEGPAINGTAKVLHWMTQQGETPDHCLVGEPSNPQTLGEAIKIGRRGSMNGTLTIEGRQGHAAYPDLANNPAPGLLAVLAKLDALKLDEGTSYFMPSNIEVTSIDMVNEAVNVIPAAARAKFNVRFNERHSSESLKALLHKLVADELEGSELEHQLAFGVSGESFMTEPGDLVQTLIDAIGEVTGNTPELSTSGGTSDARFIKDVCPVVEFGLVNATIHQVDEHVSLKDLEDLTSIYESFIGRYFEAFA